MKDALIKRFISDERFGSYRDIEEYEANLLLSKNSYIPLSFLEIALKNSIDNLLSVKLGIANSKHKCNFQKIQIMVDLRFSLCHI